MSDSDADRELVQLRRCIRDLAALAALPVVWSTGSSSRVVESLADALLGMLRLDFVYIRYRSSAGTPDMEVARLSGRPSASIESRSLGSVLEPWLEDKREPDTLPQLPGCSPALRGFVVTFGLDGATGLVATGSARVGYPSESEQLLLRVAANQAAVILARERAGSERDRLLLEVEAERKSLSQVFERSPSFMCLLSGPDHVFTRANEHYRQLVGGRDLIGKTVREALPEVVSQGFIDLLDRVFCTGETYAGYDVPVKLRNAAGRAEEQRYLDFTYQAMRGADGAVIGVMVQGIDLTERKRATAELRAKDARLQLLMNNVKDYAVILTDVSGVVMEWAGGAERITGHPAEEAIGRPVDLLFTEDDLAAGQPGLERRIARETGRAEDARWHRRRDGCRFFADGLTSPLYDEFGALHGFGKIFRDATVEWQARQGLARVARASRGMNAVLSVEAITRVLTDEARDIIGAHLAVTLLTSSEGAGAGSSTVSLSETRAREPDSAAPFISSDVLELVCKTNRPMLSSAGNCLAVPLVGHGNRNLGLIQLCDKPDGKITAQDEAIVQQLAATAAVCIENARLYDSLKEQDRRKDEFLAILAHELRNPLAPIRTGLEVLSRIGSDDKVVDNTREMMGRQIGHMVRLIDDLMDVSRISRDKLALKMEDLRLMDVIDTAVEAARPLIRAGDHALRVSMAEPDLPIRGDLTRLAQVLGNLLNNAVKYTPAGGSIAIEAQRAGSELVLRVTDTGVGIHAETLPKIFELFTQAGRSLERAQGGLGIGLALARKLVEMHGGSLEASSPGEDMGSTFTMRLPLPVEAGSRPALAAGAPAAMRPMGTLRVLVVDDNVDAAETFSLILEMSGHQTRVAHSGPEALEAVEGFEPDVVFLDIGLPGMSGYDVARQLRAMRDKTALTIVALTGWGSETDRERARQAGFDHHLTKPVEVEAAHAILDQLGRALTGHGAG